MFICERCGRQTAAKEPMRKVVVETREREYREKVQERWALVEKVVGHGHEIVREERICTRCDGQEVAR